MTDGAGVCPSCGKTYPRSSGHCSNDGTRLVAIAPTQDNMVGRVLDQRYEIRAAIAVGRIGAMYRGTQIQLAREVAIKIIHPSFAQDMARGERFVEAGRAAAQLVAPSVANVYDVGRTQDGILYVVSELIRGESLADRKTKTLPLRRVAAIGLSICEAFDAAQRANMVHGDLKPANVIVDDSSGRIVAKVVDFGLAHALAPDVAIADPRRALPLYAAPERFAGTPIDARTDLYAFGCIIYELLAGQPPFEAVTLDALAAKVHREKPTPLPPNVPQALLAIVQRLLAKSPNERFGTWKEVRAKLAPIAAELGDHVMSSPRITPPTGAPYAPRDPTTPPSAPHSVPPSVPPSAPPTAVVPPLPLSQERSTGSRILVIALVALIVSGVAIGILLAL